MEEVLNQSLSTSNGVGFPSIVQSKSSFLVPSLIRTVENQRLEHEFPFVAFQPVCLGVLVHLRKSISILNFHGASPAFMPKKCLHSKFPMSLGPHFLLDAMDQSIPRRPNTCRRYPNITKHLVTLSVGNWMPRESVFCEILGKSPIQIYFTTRNVPMIRGTNGIFTDFMDA